MADTNDYLKSLSEALQIQKELLEKSELDNLKEQLRIFQSSYASLYSIFLKKKLIHEDPYKQESKIGELEIPDTGGFIETKQLEQISLRLSNFDNQLDFLVNFYQFSVDFLSLERIKRILGLVRFIDWANLTPDSRSPNTRAVAEIAMQSKAGMDQIVLNIIGESLTKLPRSANAISGLLRTLTTYHREAYKFHAGNVRVTFDSHIRTSNVVSGFLSPALVTIPAARAIIMEIKYDGFLPDVIRDVLQIGWRNQTEFSKYVVARMV